MSGCIFRVLSPVARNLFIYWSQQEMAEARTLFFLPKHWIMECRFRVRKGKGCMIVRSPLVANIMTSRETAGLPARVLSGVRYGARFFKLEVWISGNYSDFPYIQYLTRKLCAGAPSKSIHFDMTTSSTRGVVNSVQFVWLCAPVGFFCPQVMNRTDGN